MISDEMKDIVRNTAGLASLQLSEEEVETIAPQFKKILDYMAVIEELDLDGVEPMTHVNEDQVNIWREDEVGESLPLEEALKNAPKRNEQFFKAPKVIE